MADDQDTSAPVQRHIFGDPRWVSDVELVSGWGFKAEALETLFGEPIPGPDGQPSWLVNHVQHIDQTVIAPAAALLQSSLHLVDLADQFDELDVASGIHWKSKARPNAAQAREILDALDKSDR